MNLPTLDAVADKTMLENGFIPHFPQEILEAARKLKWVPPNINHDLRHLPFCSIDNIASQDLDQLTYATTKASGYQVLVAIADVDYFVGKDSLIDQFAGKNMTSVYTPAKIYPMLPLLLSHQLTSLLPREEKIALIIDLFIDQSGESKAHDLYYALVRNHGKLNYSNVTAFLEHQRSLPIENQLSEQLILQHQIAQMIKSNRLQKGALEINTSHAIPLIKDNRVIGAVQEEKNKARELIENLMIAANLACNEFLKAHHLPRLCRVVQTPKKWERIVDIAKNHQFELPIEPNAKTLSLFLKKMQALSPSTYPELSLTILKLLGRGEYLVVDGDNTTQHFALNLRDYTHATAPNRRFADLVMSRLLKAAINRQPLPYSLDQLQEIAATCSKKESIAEKIQRKLTKCALAYWLANKIGHRFKAIVTGTNLNDTWIRVLDFPVEGKLIQGRENTEVGDHLTVMLTHVNPIEGFIDFAKV